MPSDIARIQKQQTKSGATIYVVKWRTPDGADRTKGGFSTRKAANAYATKVEAGKLRGVEFDPRQAASPSAKRQRQRYGSRAGTT